MKLEQWDLNMSYKEIAFLANFSQRNEEVIFTLAANLKRPESVIRFILKDLEDEAVEKMKEESVEKTKEESSKKIIKYKR